MRLIQASENGGGAAYRLDFRLEPGKYIACHWAFIGVGQVGDMERLIPLNGGRKLNHVSFSM